jgi:DNA polymerase III psi subunit
LAKSQVRRGPALLPVDESLVCPILAGFRLSASAVRHLKSIRIPKVNFHNQS